MKNPLKILTGRRAALGVFGALWLAALLPYPAAATGPDAETIARVEAYLNGLRTLKSKFVQTTSNGAYAEGMLYIQRPGKMRLDYAPPAQLQIYATGTWLIMVDKELKEVNQIPLASTPASVLVRNNVRLSGDVAVQSIRQEAGTLRVRLAKSDERDAGSLTLVFNAQPLLLREWSVTDAQGVTTRVALQEPQTNVDIPRSVFNFTPPDWAYPQ